MTRDDLPALIARVEAATGPDRKLDSMILLAVTPGGSWRQNSDGVWLLRVEDDSTPGETARTYRDPPAYTASLDAAMALVPERWLWVVGSMGNARVHEDQTSGRDAIGQAATPALALTAAALRARLASMGDDA
jgi:hypothetical protein